MVASRNRAHPRDTTVNLDKQKKNVSSLQKRNILYYVQEFGGRSIAVGAHFQLGLLAIGHTVPLASPPLNVTEQGSASFFIKELIQGNRFK